MNEEIYVTRDAFFHLHPAQVSVAAVEVRDASNYLRYL